MRHLARVMPLTVLLLAGPGCRQDHEHEKSPPIRQASLSEPLVQEASGITGRLVVSPMPPRAMKQATLRLELHDAKGRPVTGRAVRFDLTMPAMAMPPNQPRVTEPSGGTYEAAATFTMSGAWEVLAQVAGEDRPVRLTFPLNVP